MGPISGMQLPQMASSLGGIQKASANSGASQSCNCGQKDGSQTQQPGSQQQDGSTPQGDTAQMVFQTLGMMFSLMGNLFTQLGQSLGQNQGNNPVNGPGGGGYQTLQAQPLGGAGGGQTQLAGLSSPQGAASLKQLGA